MIFARAAGSSSGRMRLSESRHLGSNPSPAALAEMVVASSATRRKGGDYRL